MARSREEIAAHLRAGHPEMRELVNGELVTLDPARYEDRLLSWVEATERSETQDDAAATDRALVREALAALDAGTATSRQVQTILARLVRRALTTD